MKRHVTCLCDLNHAGNSNRATERESTTRQTETWRDADLNEAAVQQTLTRVPEPTMIATD